MERLLQYLAKLESIFRQDPRVLAVYLFGSHAEGYVMPWSDIDLAVLWTESVSFSTEVALDTGISLALGTDSVDVVNLNKAPLAFQYHVLATGRLLYESNPSRVADFAEQTLVHYFDFQPVLQIYEREFMKSLEQDYGVQSRHG